MLQTLYYWAATTIPPGDVGVPNVPLNDAALASILNIVFTVTGGLATLFVLIGAVRYIASGGDQAGIKQAKDTILYSLIGVVVSLSAFTIVQFTIGKVSGSI
jgi:hypothetical protein